MKLHELFDLEIIGPLIVAELTPRDLTKLAQVSSALRVLMQDKTSALKVLYSFNHELHLPYSLQIHQICRDPHYLVKTINIYKQTSVTNRNLSTSLKIAILELQLPEDFLTHLRSSYSFDYKLEESAVPTHVLCQLAQLHFHLSFEGMPNLHCILKALLYSIYASKRSDITLPNLLFGFFVLRISQLAKKDFSVSVDYLRMLESYIQSCASFISHRLAMKVRHSYPGFNDVLNLPLLDFISQPFSLIFMASQVKYMEKKPVGPEDWGQYLFILDNLSVLLKHVSVSILIRLKDEIIDLLFRGYAPHLDLLLNAINSEVLLKCELHVAKFLLSPGGLFLVESMLINKKNSSAFVAKLTELEVEVLESFMSDTANLIGVFRVKELRKIFRENHSSVSAQPQPQAVEKAPRPTRSRESLFIKFVQTLDEQQHGIIPDLIMHESILEYTQDKNKLLLLHRKNLLTVLDTPNFSSLTIWLLRKTEIELEKALNIPAIQLLLTCKNPNLLLDRYNIGIFIARPRILLSLLNLMRTNYKFTKMFIEYCPRRRLLSFYLRQILQKLESLKGFVFQYLLTAQIPVEDIIKNLDFYVFISNYPNLPRLINKIGILFFKDCYYEALLPIFDLLNDLKHIDSQSLSLLLNLFAPAYRRGVFDPCYLRTIIDNGLLAGVLKGLTKRALKKFTWPEIKELNQANNAGRNYLTFFGTLPKNLRNKLIETNLGMGSVNIRKLKKCLDNADLQMLSHSQHTKRLLRKLPLENCLDLERKSLDFRLLVEEATAEVSKLMLLAKTLLEPKKAEDKPPISKVTTIDDEFRTIDTPRRLNLSNSV